jgi:hypothetical protein
MQPVSGTIFRLLSTGGLPQSGDHSGATACADTHDHPATFDMQQLHQSGRHHNHGNDPRALGAF